MSTSGPVGACRLVECRPVEGHPKRPTKAPTRIDELIGKRRNTYVLGQQMADAKNAESEAAVRVLLEID